MRPQFDAKDAEILAVRETAFNQVTGPRVGDFLKTADGFLRFTHDWGESIQTTVGPKHPCHGDSSFYLGNGFADFSGSLDRAIDKTLLRDTGETMEGSFWFFHHNHACAENGVYFRMACRVFERLPYIDEHGEFRCPCGNYPNAEGAYPCDHNGKQVPGWGRLWCCDRCGLIFEAAAYHRGVCPIIGRRSDK